MSSSIRKLVVCDGITGTSLVIERAAVDMLPSVGARLVERLVAAEPAVAAAERHTRPLEGGLVPRRRGLRPRLLAAVVRSKATLAFAAERQVVMRIHGR